ncbi:MAG: sugar phosphate isomerase/epimerase [Eubacteriales bacterium]|nr:sugar phosphate isomerase/epimerase [Eubacteriales bacterium]
MQFGMPTLIETKSIEECAALCGKLGLDFIEISMDMPDYQVDRLSTDKLRQIADQYNIFYTIHLEGFLDPCAFNNRVAKAYTDTVLQVIEIAKKLDIPVLNMHLNRGDHFTLPDRKVSLYDVYKKEYLYKLTDFRNKCVTAIGDADIKICVENCGDYARCPFIVEGLDILLQDFKFALCFDIGHNAAADYSDEPTVMKRAERLCHMHVHDAKGLKNHLTLGDGNVDIKKYLILAKEHNCRAVLEVKTVDGLRKSVAYLKSHLL